MRKMTFIMALFVSLMLTLTPLAMGRWKANVVTNQTTSTVHIVFSTWRPATQTIPPGHRITGHYPVASGQAHTFYAWANNAFYLQIYHPSLKTIKPVDVSTFDAPVLTDAFEIVQEKEISASGANRVLYAQPAGEYPTEDGFLKYPNGTPVTITSAWVNINEESPPVARPQPATPPVEPPPPVVVPHSDLVDELYDLVDELYDTLVDRRAREELYDLEEELYDLEDGGTEAELLALKQKLLALIPGDAPADGEEDGDGPADGEEDGDGPADGEEDPVVAEPVVSEDPVGVNAELTSSPTGTPLELGDTRSVTIRLTENGQAMPLERVTFSTTTSSNDVKLDPLSATELTTNDDGEATVSVTVGAQSRPGTFKVIAEVPRLKATEGLEPVSLEFTVSGDSGEVAGGLTISAPSKVEPRGGSFNGAINLTFTLKSVANTALSGKKLHLINSGSVNSSLGSTPLTTNANGTATTTLTIRKEDEGRTGSITVRASVEGSNVSKSQTITVAQTPASLSVSGVPSSITSGNTRTITATVRSKNGTPMSGVRVEFSDSDDSEIAFSPTSRNTNSSGQASSTLRTGSYGSADFVVKASGMSKSYSLTVTRETRSFTRQTEVLSVKGSCEGPWYNWTRYAQVPGEIVWARTKYTIPGSDRCCMEFHGSSFSGDTLEAWGRTRFHCEDQNEIYITFSGEYYWSASSPGAPSLQPQLRHETDPLSAVWQDLSQVPSETALLRNYPNPFNPETWLPYHLAEPAEVTLSIYSAGGQLVRTLALGHQPAGIYASKSRAAYWDGRNAVGERVASGLYFYTLTAGDFAATGKMLIRK